MTFKTEALENEDFGLVEPDRVNTILAALEKVDLAKVRREVQEVNQEELEEQEVTDWEMLVD